MLLGFPLRHYLVYLFAGVGKKLIHTEFEKEAVIEKGPQNRGLMITVGILGKTKRRHGGQIDPLLLAVQYLPEPLDIHLDTQFASTIGDLLESGYQLVTGPGNVQTEICFDGRAG